jgi:hypothetical protein
VEEAMSDVTLILNALEGGDDRAIDRLLPAVYEELRPLAAQKLSHERPGHTLQATALVHEAYLRLIGADNASFTSRAFFFGAAAEAMRRILIENARRKQRLTPNLGKGAMAENLDLLNTAVSLLIRAALPTARFSGWVRERSLEPAARRDVDDDAGLRAGSVGRDA